MISLTAEGQIGPLLRRLRLGAGLSLRDVATVAHLSKSGVAKREQSRGGYLGAFVETVGAFGYDLALIPQRHPGARPTGTGWPA